MTDKKLNTYCEEIATDESLKILTKYTLHGWLEKENVEPSVKPFYNSSENISMLNEILLIGNKIIVLSDLHGKVRNTIHSGH